MEQTTISKDFESWADALAVHLQKEGVPEQELEAVPHEESEAQKLLKIAILKQQELQKPLLGIQSMETCTFAHGSLWASCESAPNGLKEMEKRRLAHLSDVTHKEAEYLKTTAGKRSRTLQQFAGVPHGTSCDIGLCFSGGSFRAMIGTLAYLTAFESHGLLNASSYIATLSGSSWAASAWYGGAGNPPAIPDLQYLRDVCGRGLPFSLFDGPKILTALKSKINKEMLRPNFCDLWGLYLGSRYLEPLVLDSWDTLGLSGTASKMELHKLPLPIITTIVPSSPTAASKWMELTPYTASASCTSIPMDEFGCTFTGVHASGPSDDQLHYLMAVSGAFLGAPVSQFPPYFTDNLFHLLGTRFPGMATAALPGFRGMIPNFTPSFPDPEFLELGDPGMECNLPLQPLRKRGAKIIIVCDMTMGMEKDPAGELRKEFPDLPVGFGAEPYQTFQPQDGSGSLVIYMPALKDNVNWETKFSTLTWWPSEDLIQEYFENIRANVHNSITLAKKNIREFLASSSLKGIL